MKNLKNCILNLPTNDGLERECFLKFNVQDYKKHPLITILKLSGLYFGEKSDGKWYYFGLVRACLMCVLTSYYTLYLTFYILCKKKYDDTTASTVFMISWMFLSSLTMIFLIYWQLNGYLTNLFQILRWPDQTYPRSTRNSIKIVYLLYFLAVLFNVFYILGALYTLLTERWIEGLSKNFGVMDVMNGFGGDWMRYSTVVLLSFAWNAWINCLVFYIVVNYILHGNFLMFNEELMEVGNDDVKRDLSVQLVQKYTEHIILARIVRTVDHTFEVYTFAMMATNIPTTIFSLLSCFTAFRLATGSFLTAAFFFLPPPIFSILQLVGLSAVPAKVHSAIQEVRNILYSNPRIWHPFDERTYQIASVFVNHVEQANIGISVWGFTIVTKPLILTTISLTVTYLTLVMQLQISPEQSYDAEIIQNYTEHIYKNITETFRQYVNFTL